MRRKVGIKLSEKQKNEVRQALKDVKDNRSFRAMTGVLLRSDGYTAKSVAKTLGVNKKQVFEWCKRYKKNGVRGLFLGKPPGRPPIEGSKAKKRIPEILKEEPKMFGFLKGRWVVRDISKELKKEGIKLSFQSVDRILHEMEISLKRPRLGALGSLHKDYRKRKDVANYRKASSALIKKGLL